MEKLHQYENSVSWSGKLQGELIAPGLPSISIGSPPDFGGEGGRWSPEQFLVASTNACIMLTFVVIANYSKLDLAGYSSSARGTVEKVEGRGYQFTSVEVEAQVRVKAEADVERAERLMRKAEKSCLVSRSLGVPVEVKSHITVAGE